VIAMALLDKLKKEKEEKEALKEEIEKLKEEIKELKEKLKGGIGNEKK
jgi:cell division septum initiation protein DivIVA